MAKAKPAHRILMDAKLHDTYWGKNIVASEKRGHFDNDDIDKAASWVTCACGELHEDIPRNKNIHDVDFNEPDDQRLSDLGRWFFTSVTTHSFKEAARTLIDIEARAAIVMRQLSTLLNKDPRDANKQPKQHTY